MIKNVRAPEMDIAPELNEILHGGQRRSESVLCRAGQAEGNSAPLGSLYLYSTQQFKVAETTQRVLVETVNFVCPNKKQTC